MDTGHATDAIVLEDRAAQPALSVRATIPTSRLSEAQGEGLADVIVSMRRRGIVPAGPVFVRYHSFDDGEADLETGIPVRDPEAGDGVVVPSELPGGTVISVWHVGSHDRLGEAYARIDAWLGQHGRGRTGPSWEIYTWIDPTVDPDPAIWPEPSAWRTELVQPVSSPDAEQDGG